MGARARFLGLVLAAVTPAACAGAAERGTASTVPAANGETEWEDWTRATFARAREEKRIILINVVATWCHWCHVMEEETYADPQVAALLRDHFVTIRIDSDARPDIAERYRAWGWPATAVLSPDAQPILELRGYQNPRRFEALLQELIAERDAGKLARRGELPPEPRPTDASIDALRRLAKKQLDAFYDEERGGWGEVQKYPFPGQMEHALVRGRIHGGDRWLGRAKFTLEGWKKIIDPVWGGMYQYSLQQSWDHPHYEKITAIQGGAIFNFALAARTTGDDAWLEPARAIAGYMDAFMRSPDGGYFTSQDADLRRPGKPAVVGADYYALPDAQRRALGIPRIDDNVYADLNGHMIRGLAELYAASGDEAVLAAAVKAAERVLATHRTERGFLHGEGEGLIYLQDQAAMGFAFVALHRATADRRWLDEARALAELLCATLQDRERGGFWAHSEDPEAVGVFAERRKPIAENALTARFLIATHRLLDGDGTVETPYLDAARKALVAVGDAKAVHAEGRIVDTYLLALEELSMPIVDITVVGDRGDATTRALHRAALRYPEPRGVLELQTPGERYPDIGKPAVYFCTATACSTPITDPAKLAEKANAFLETALPPA